MRNSRTRRAIRSLMPASGVGRAVASCMVDGFSIKLEYRVNEIAGYQTPNSQSDRILAPRAAPA
ncbi:hypothetical protein BVI434_1660026 [Burkholderia vietnamiensis]|nr:hypothetical protein BVI434_1660026 [Burkholderia vietnamiensis]